LGEEYRSWTSSLWSFLHSPVTSSLLGELYIVITKNRNYIISTVEVSTKPNIPFVGSQSFKISRLFFVYAFHLKVWF
jgi:hypothetical protein